MPTATATLRRNLHDAPASPNDLPGFAASILDLRDEVRQRVGNLIDRAERAGRTQLLRTEQDEYDAAITDMAELDTRLRELADEEQRAKVSGRSALRFGGAHVTYEQGVYGRGSPNGYLRDLIHRQVFGDGAAVDRLAQYAHEVDVERRDLNRTDGTGGEWVPPLWLVDEGIPAVRAGRVTADRLTREELPPGTSLLEIPKSSTGAVVAAQTADLANVSDVDPATTSVGAPVQTLAGQVGVSIQALDQSPNNALQTFLMSDLLADFNRALDAQVLNGTGTTGQLQGILGLSGTGTTSFTTGSPTVPLLYPKAAGAIQSVVTTRFETPECFVMAPRRWVWMLAALDANNRPLVVPTGQGPFDATATGAELNSLATPVGSMLGLPVYIDGNVPVNLGVGGNQDAIIAGRFSDSVLFSSSLRTRILPEVGSAQLAVRIQIVRIRRPRAPLPAQLRDRFGYGLGHPDAVGDQRGATGLREFR
jgi:HK97 family phage major capsid protein